MSLSESEFYMVISFGHSTERLQLTGSRCCDFSVGDESGILAGRRDGMHLCVCGFREPNLI